MTMWLYQMSQTQWPPNSYRLDIWENERWRWPTGTRVPKGLEPGDRVAFFYARKGGPEPGFYGWAVVLDLHDDGRGMYFRPVAPSDHLKMDPWWDERAAAIADEVRGTVKQGTMWRIADETAKEISAGIAAWLARRSRV
jgi:hypothetical protein